MMVGECTCETLLHLDKFLQQHIRFFKYVYALKTSDIFPERIWCTKLHVTFKSLISCSASAVALWFPGVCVCVCVCVCVWRLLFD